MILNNFGYFPLSGLGFMEEIESDFSTRPRIKQHPPHRSMESGVLMMWKQFSFLVNLHSLQLRWPAQQCPHSYSCKCAAGEPAGCSTARHGSSVPCPLSAPHRSIELFPWLQWFVPGSHCHLHLPLPLHWPGDPATLHSIRYSNTSGPLLPQDICTIRLLCSHTLPCLINH